MLVVGQKRPLKQNGPISGPSRVLHRSHSPCLWDNRVALYANGARLFGFGRLAGRQLLTDPRRLSGALAKVIKLCAADVALALHLDRGDQRRIGLKRPLDAFAARYLAHRKRGVEPAIALGDDDAFISLDAFALAFDDAYADDDGIARCEFRDRLAQ